MTANMQTTTMTTKPSRGRPVGNVFKTVQSLYSQPSSKPKPEVFLHDEDIKNMDIDPVCVRETKEEATLPQTVHMCDNDRQWNNYTPGVDCKHVVVFDSTALGEGFAALPEFKNQVGMMSCLDIAQVLSMQGKYLCACQHGDGEHKVKWEEARDCYKKRKVDHGRCVHVKEEDDAKITPMERHCMECRDARIWEDNLARNISVQHPDGVSLVTEAGSVTDVPKWDFHGSDYVRVQAVVGVGKKRARV